MDCGPIIDPLTASAARMANLSFIIGQNEPITFQSLQNYALRIKELFSDFTASSVKIIINKVRGPILASPSSSPSTVFAAMPFTIEVVDFSEGITHIDEIRLLLFDYYVLRVLEATFRQLRVDLNVGPECVLKLYQRRAIDELIQNYMSSHWHPWYRSWRIIGLGICGVCALVLSFILWASQSTAQGKEAVGNVWQAMVTFMPYVSAAIGVVLMGWAGYSFKVIAPARFLWK